MYILFNHQRGLPYLGRSADLLRRKNEHFGPDHRNYHNNRLSNAIDYYGINYFTFHVLKYCDTDDECKKWEQFFLNKLRPFGARGYNISETSEFGRTPASFEEFIYKAHKKHNNKYQYYKDGYVNQFSSIQIKCPIHGFFTQRVKTHLKGHGCQKCAVVKTTANISSPVLQLDKNTRTIIKEFPSLESASREVRGLVVNIRQSLKTGWVSYGFRWILKFPEQKRILLNSGKQIAQKNPKNKEIIQIFSSAREASTILTNQGFSISWKGISEVVNGKSHTHGGFFWEYID